MELTISIIGILITLYFSFRQFQKTGLVLYEIDGESTDVTKYENFQTFEVNLGSRKLQKKFHYYKGIIFVVGEQDIEKKNIENISLSGGENKVDFKSFNIISDSPEVSSIVSTNEIEISTGSLKGRDVILFETVFEGDKNKLQLDYRILHAKKISKIYQYNSLASYWKSAIAGWAVCVFILFMYNWLISANSYSFSPIYYSDDIPVSLKYRDLMNKQYNKGISKAEDVVKINIDTVSKEGNVPVYELEYLRKRIGIDLNSLRYKVKDEFHYDIQSTKVIDSLTNNRTILGLVFDRSYKKIFKLDDDIKVTFEFKDYFAVFMVILLNVIVYLLLYFSISTTYVYFSFGLPLKRKLKQLKLRFDSDEAANS